MTTHISDAAASSTTPAAASAITVRPAREADVDVIVDLVQVAYRGEGGWTTEAHLVSGSRTHAAEVREMLADPAVTLLAAEIDTFDGLDGLDTLADASGPDSVEAADDAPATSPGHAEHAGRPGHAADSPAPSGPRVVGCCYTRQEPADDDGITRAELGLFAVHPGIQSRGLGGRLLEAQAEHLREAGIEILMIRVLQSRPELHAWYERHGFVRTGASVPFAGNPDWLQVEGLGMDVMERPLQAG
ncbi:MULTISPECIES: GNAT family N-acetyltransferase [Brachybacterium]|uniref:GNAT family N-acetyltransferase n=1 Tax=Brachybacterium TaxID=43668 RepID=UPI000DF2E61E|nr:GNAT family N-acetyltransferase [Brachybacterium sp. JB7]RCS65751.1 GNAT family N-acetyltransferase [Brachybacterium sp. JB7]